ncbi:MAG: hypothetical protein PHC70_00180 [Patescibacteria group bacterium]|nr:hypothetical protein [Patescibacteria group bacterium]
MFRRVIGLVKGERVIFVMKTATGDRLRKTCFRGQDVAKAGNFTAWESFSDLANDVLPVLGDKIKERIEEAPSKRRSTARFELELGHRVGWSSTDARTEYGDHELEPFKPNQRTNAMRVRRDSGLMAPATSFMTFVCEIRHHEDTRDWMVFVHSVYPGQDVGSLQGNIRDVVFFDWEHPGESDLDDAEDDDSEFEDAATTQSAF